MINDKKIRTIIRSRDPETLEMEYAIGFKEEEARRLRSLLQGDNFRTMQEDQGDAPWDRVIKKLDWVVETAEADRQRAQDKTQDELP